jgi:hypothetical protein
MKSFWDKVKIRSGIGCWEWQAYCNKDGYGQVGYQGTVTGAHRVSWILENGPIPDGLCVLHKCDNPSCVRPDHLFLGTRVDNSDDKVAKGRQAKGITHRQYGKFGADHPFFGGHHSEDAKARISEFQKGRPKSSETIEKMKAAHSALAEKKSADMTRVWEERKANWVSKYDDKNIILDYVSGCIDNKELMVKYGIGSTSTLYVILRRNHIPLKGAKHEVKPRQW